MKAFLIEYFELIAPLIVGIPLVLVVAWAVHKARRGPTW